jgi:hypothetical protein
MIETIALLGLIAGIIFLVIAWAKKHAEAGVDFPQGDGGSD